MEDRIRGKGGTIWKKETTSFFEGSSGVCYQVTGITGPHKDKQGYLKRPQTRDVSRGQIDAQSDDLVREAKALSIMAKRLTVHGEKRTASLIDIRVPELLDEGDEPFDDYSIHFIITGVAQGQSLKDINERGNLTPAIALRCLYGYVRLIELAHLDIVHIGEQKSDPSRYVYKGEDFTKDEAFQYVYNDAQLNHIFWHESPPLVTLIDWGNSRPTKDGKTTDGLTSLDHDWEQLTSLATTLLDKLPYSTGPYGEAVQRLRSPQASNGSFSADQFRNDLTTVLKGIRLDFEKYSASLNTLLSWPLPAVTKDKAYFRELKNKEAELENIIAQLRLLASLTRDNQTKILTWRQARLLEALDEPDYEGILLLCQAILDDSPTSMEVVGRVKTLAGIAQKSGHPDNQMILTSARYHLKGDTGSAICQLVNEWPVSSARAQVRDILSPLLLLENDLPPGYNLLRLVQQFRNEISDYQRDTSIKEKKEKLDSIARRLERLIVGPTSTDDTSSDGYKVKDWSDVPGLVPWSENELQVPHRPIYGYLNNILEDARRIRAVREDLYEDIIRVSGIVFEMYQAWDTQKFIEAQRRLALLHVVDPTKEYFSRAIAWVSKAENTLTEIKHPKPKETINPSKLEHWGIQMKDLEEHFDHAPWIKNYGSQLDQIKKLWNDAKGKRRIGSYSDARTRLSEALALANDLPGVKKALAEELDKIPGPYPPIPGPYPPIPDEEYYARMFDEDLQKGYYDSAEVRLQYIQHMAPRSRRLILNLFRNLEYGPLPKANDQSLFISASDREAYDEGLNQHLIVVGRIREWFNRYNQSVSSAAEYINNWPGNEKYRVGKSIKYYTFKVNSLLDAVRKFWDTRKLYAGSFADWPEIHTTMQEVSTKVNEIESNWDVSTISEIAARFDSLLSLWLKVPWDSTFNVKGYIDKQTHEIAAENVRLTEVIKKTTSAENKYKQLLSENEQKSAKIPQFILGIVFLVVGIVCFFSSIALFLLGFIGLIFLGISLVINVIGIILLVYKKKNSEPVDSARAILQDLSWIEREFFRNNYPYQTSIPMSAQVKPDPLCKNQYREKVLNEAWEQKNKAQRINAFQKILEDDPNHPLRDWIKEGITVDTHRRSTTAIILLFSLIFLIISAWRFGLCLFPATRQDASTGTPTAEIKLPIVEGIRSITTAIIPTAASEKSCAEIQTLFDQGRYSDIVIYLASATNEENRNFYQVCLPPNWELWPQASERITLVKHALSNHDIGQAAEIIKKIPPGEAWKMEVDQLNKEIHNLLPTWTRCVTALGDPSMDSFNEYKTIQNDIWDGQLPMDTLEAACGVGLVELSRLFQDLPVHEIDLLNTNYFPYETDPVYWAIDLSGKTKFHLRLPGDKTNDLRIWEGYLDDIATSRVITDLQRESDVVFFEVAFSKIIDDFPVPKTAYGILFSTAQDETWRICGTLLDREQFAVIVTRQSEKVCDIGSNAGDVERVVWLKPNERLKKIKITYTESQVDFEINTSDDRIINIPPLNIQPHRIRLGLLAQGKRSQVHLLLNTMSLGLRGGSNER